MLGKVIAVVWIVALVDRVTSLKDHLTTSVRPTNYNLSLEFFTDEDADTNFTFAGVVVIKLEVDEPVLSLTLYADNLTIDRDGFSLRRIDGGVVENCTLDFDGSDRIDIFINNGKLLTQGSYVMVIKYVGLVGDKYEGVYKIPYENEKKEKAWIIATHFEPNYARRLLPCFDEPYFKATFDLTVTSPKKYKALSNAPVKQLSFSNTTITTRFETTPPMSTYLLALVLSDLDHIGNANDNLTIYAPASDVKYGNFALKLGEKLLRLFEKLTGIRYAMGKIDQVSLPGDWKEAMENWGLIIYGQRQILFDAKRHTTLEKHEVSIVVAHEFAHQWFGNIATPRYWKHLWLSEGVSTFFSYYAMDKIEPSWRLMDRFVVYNVFQSAYDFYGSLYASAISPDNFDDFKQLFHPHVYVKGGAICRMMRYIFTESVFLKAMQLYLNKTYHGTADSDDFFLAFQEVTDAHNFNVSVKYVMEPWIRLQGYPIINVTRHYGSGSADISQKRFFSYNVRKRDRIHGYIWRVPITYASAKTLNFEDTVPDHWLTEASMTVSLKAEPNDWVIVNKQQIGYFRVNYDDKNWRLIINGLKSDDREKIHVLNRAQLINDALALVQQEQLDIDIFLELISYLENETDYVAWIPAFDAIYWINAKLIGSKHLPIFSECLKRMLRRASQTVGLRKSAEDNDVTRLFRVKLIELMCALGDATCVSEMHDQLIDYLKNPREHEIPADVRHHVLCFGLRQANYSTWRKIVDVSGELKLKEALECSGNGEILRMYFNDTLAKRLSVDEKLMIVKDLPENRSEEIETILDLLDIITGSAGFDFKRRRFYLSWITIQLADKLTTEAQLTRLESSKFMKTFSVYISENIRKKIIKNIDWLKRNDVVLTKTLKDLKCKTD